MVRAPFLFMKCSIQIKYNFRFTAPRRGGRRDRWKIASSRWD